MITVTYRLRALGMMMLLAMDIIISTLYEYYMLYVLLHLHLPIYHVLISCIVKYYILFNSVVL